MRWQERLFYQLAGTKFDMLERLCASRKAGLSGPDALIDQRYGRLADSLTVLIERDITRAERRIKQREPKVLHAYDAPLAQGILQKRRLGVARVAEYYGISKGTVARVLRRAYPVVVQ